MSLTLEQENTILDIRCLMNIWSSMPAADRRRRLVEFNGDKEPKATLIKVHH